MSIQLKLAFMDFNKMFRHEGLRSQDKFLSRLFGIFSEEIVRIWASDETVAPYRDLGRPTVKTQLEVKNRGRGCTFDFALEEKKSGRKFICEQKCELEFENYRYLELKKPEQLEHHEKNLAFRRFLDIGKDPRKYQVFLKGRQIEKVHGIVLIWGKVSEAGRKEVKERYHINDVLSLEDIINDLVVWGSNSYLVMIREKQKWCKDLFHNLVSSDASDCFGRARV
jgi:hypothetical protein